MDRGNKILGNFPDQIFATFVVHCLVKNLSLPMPPTEYRESWIREHMLSRDLV